jgi:hypothetical protein
VNKKRWLIVLVLLLAALSFFVPQAEAQEEKVEIPQGSGIWVKTQSGDFPVTLVANTVVTVITRDQSYTLFSIPAGTQVRLSDGSVVPVVYDSEGIVYNAVASHDIEDHKEFPTSLVHLSTFLLILSVVLILIGALFHLPEWLEVILETENIVSILGVVFYLYIRNVVGIHLSLPMQEIVLVTVITSVGSAIALFFLVTNVIKRFSNKYGDGLIAFIAIGIVPLLGSLIGEPGAMLISSTLLMGVFTSLKHHKYAKYMLLGCMFTSIAMGGLLSAFAAPPVAVLAAAWKFNTAWMFKTFMIPLSISQILLGIYAAFLATRSEDVQIEKVEFTTWKIALIGPRTGIFLFSVIVIVHVAAGNLNFLYTGNDQEIFIKNALATTLIDNAGLAEGAVSQVAGEVDTTVFEDGAKLTVSTPDENTRFWVIISLLITAGMTILANAPNVVGAMMVADSFEDKRVNFLTQAFTAVPSMLIPLVVFVVWGLTYYFSG